MTMQTRISFVLGVSCSLLSACGEQGPGNDGPTGRLGATIEASSTANDATAVRVDVVSSEEDCDAEPMFTKTVSLAAGTLPESDAGPVARAFAGALFVLLPGSYRVCATPLAGENPSEQCGRADATADVAAEVTTEVALTSQCAGEGKGGIGVVVSLNDAPEITSIELDPSQWISVCESVHLGASATDPNGDPLTYAWSVTGGPNGSSLHTANESATFSGPAGDYELALTVEDGHGGADSFTFPIHVSDAVCEVPEAVQQIFTGRCSPCHTVNSSAGLRLDPSAASYANLVGVGSSAAACSSRTRVIPGNSADSYLIAKLRGEPGICGLRMPRNLPALPEDEIQTIADWIDGLPH
jgi:hypothetical protein